MIPNAALISCALLSISSAAEHPGKAVADWIFASPQVAAGETVQTGIRLVVDEGWHTYWSNPGEGGMKISVKWELPDGWRAGEVEQPAPIRFMTGELPGYGYTGTVIFPVKLTPPADFSGEAELKADVAWLACNDSSCVPGNAGLTLKIAAGPAAEGPAAADLKAAVAQVPVPAGDGVTLMVEEMADDLVLTLTAPEASGLQPGEAKVYPFTPQVVDDAEVIRFEKSGAVWKTEVPKSEYAAKSLAELTLVLTGASEAGPISVTWKAD